MQQVSSTPRQPAPPHKFSQFFYTELKRCVSVESVRLFSDKDLNAKQQEKKGAEFYHGFGPVASQVQRFIQGKGIYSNLFDTEPTPSGNGQTLILREDLHHEPGKRMVVGSNLTLTQMQTSRGNLLMSGRTIRNYAQETIKEAKKMLSLLDEAVTSKILKKVDGEYEFDSGKGMVDLVEFIFHRMYHWKHYNGATVNGDEVNGADGTTINTGDDGNNTGTTGTGEDGNNTGTGEVAGTDIGIPGEDGNTANTSSDDLSSPPYEYIPVGFVFFMTRGPMADKEFRLTSINLDDIVGFIGQGKGRASHRSQEAKDKSSTRDHDNGTATDPRQQRGISLGGSQLEVASVAQNQARITNEEFQGELVRHDLLMTSKRDRMKSELEMAKLLLSMGDEDEAKLHIQEAKALMKAVKNIEDSLQDLKKRKTQSDGVEVEEYLKRGRFAMGITSVSGVTQPSTLALTTPRRLDDALTVGNPPEVTPDDMEEV